MADINEIRALCFDHTGVPKTKDDCRAVVINHLILDEMLDVDEAEERTDKVLNELGLWPEEKRQEEDVENL
ncbi:MAG: hypothetical protein KIH65_005170 [Candidatus Uhrbacteria bacterium]|nr:hypothetical protein [Candidatus Uhrbacteria bacterium]